MDNFDFKQKFISNNCILKAQEYGNDVHIRSIKVTKWGSDGDCEEVSSKLKYFLEELLMKHEVMIFRVKVSHQPIYDGCVYAFASFVSPSYTYEVLKEKVIVTLNKTMYRGRNLVAMDACKRRKFMSTTMCLLTRHMSNVATQTDTGNQPTKIESECLKCLLKKTTLFYPK
jgi:hypothetical protein